MVCWLIRGARKYLAPHPTSPRTASPHHNHPVRHRVSDAFVLVTHALREKDRIVSLLTRDAGVKRGVARGARGARSAFAGLLEPMTEARVAYFEKDGQELVSIGSLDPI